MNKLILILIVLPLLIGMRACSWSPSTFFRGIDENNDHKLSYKEWMTYYTLRMHNHPIENCSRRDFYFADCNLDDHLTWKEYYDFRFKYKSCKSPAVMTLIQKYESNSELQASPNRMAVESLISHQIEELMVREEQLKKRYGVVSNAQ